MKIKIIDLLNKIAEGKELPEKFMYKGHLYYRQKTKGICYRCDELNEIFEEFYPSCSNMIIDYWMPNKNWEGCNVNDPSARVLANYGASGK